MDLTEAENIKKNLYKRMYKNIFMTQIITIV